MGENSPHARVHTPAMHHHHLRAGAEGFGIEGVFYSSHSAFSTSKVIILGFVVLQNSLLNHWLGWVSTIILLFKMKTL